MLLRKLVSLGFLALVACGVDPSTDGEVELAADASVETADSGLPAVAGDAGNSGGGDSAAASVDARAVAPGNSWAADARSEAGSGCLLGVDADGDGYPASAPACAGEAVPQLDCYDDNKLAHPGQVGRFATDRGDGSFDYDCDGKETGIYTNVAVCPDVSGWTCPPPPDQDKSAPCDYNTQLNPYRLAEEGWAREVPKCGVTDGFGLNLTWDNVTKKFSCFASPNYGLMYENTMLQLCN